MASLNFEVYEPPRKGLPYLTVAVMGTHIEVSRASATREEAEQIRDDEYAIFQAKLELNKKFGVSD